MARSEIEVNQFVSRYPSDQSPSRSYRISRRGFIAAILSLGVNAATPQVLDPGANLNTFPVQQNEEARTVSPDHIDVPPARTVAIPTLTPISPTSTSTPTPTMEPTPEPATKIIPNPFIGIRNGNPNRMGDVSKLGMDIVRVNGEALDLSCNSASTEQIKSAIHAAEKQHLEIVYIFHPHELRTPEQTKAQLQPIYQSVGNYDNFILELGNEENDPRYWKNGNLKQFSQFLKDTSDIAWSLYPGAKLMIGALSDPTRYG